MKKPIIVLTGPTASGKTTLSFDLVKKFNGEIICADSMTVYRGMDIGTDKPTLEIKDPKLKVQNPDGSYEIKGIRHHLLDILNPDEEFNAAIFQKMVTKIIEDIHRRGKIPFLVGGSTLYIDAFVYDYNFPEIVPDPKLRAILELKTNEELFCEICKLDPDCEWTVDRNNRRRLIRALEILIKSGKSLSEQKTKKPLPENILYLSVDCPRELLYGKINKRVDIMVKDGFIEEVKSLVKKYDSNSAMQAAGYKQLSNYLAGNESLEAAVEKTKQVHRNFAKRQLTWLKRNKDVIWVKNNQQAEQIVENFLGANGPVLY